MRLNEKELRILASSVGMNEKAVERILSSVRVPTVTEDGSPGPVTDLGLRISGEGVFMQHLAILRSGTSPAWLLDALEDYQRSCPKIIGWLGRGDFNPNDVPSTISRAELRHGAITAGRVRAKALQKL